MKRPAIEHLPALAVIALYLVLASRHIDLPGIQYDEVLQAPAAFVMVKGDANGDYNRFSSARIAGRFLILMNMEYIGALKSYLLAAVFSLFGISVPALRLTMIFVSAMALWFTWLFGRQFLGSGAALAGLLLAATDPSLIMLTRVDWGPVALAFLFRMSALFFLLKWWRSGGRTVHLVIAGGLLGLGVYDKTNFLWFVLALAAAGIVCRLLDARRPEVTPRGLLSAVCAGLVTSLPLWVYNVHYGWLTFRMLDSARASTPVWRLVQLIQPRARILLELMNGIGLDRFQFGETVSPAVGWFRTLLLPLAAVSIGVLAWHAIRGRELKGLFLPLLAVLIAVQIYLTPLPIGMHHWVMIFPLPHLIVGAAFGRLRESLKKPMAVAGVLVLLVAAGLNIRAMAGYYGLMVRTGGVAHWSAEINGLAGTLIRHYPDRQIQLMDWGFGNTLFLLSGGRLRTREPFWAYARNPEPDAKLLGLVRDPSNVFVFNAPGRGSFPNARKAFDSAIERAGLRVLREEIIYDRRSMPVYSILELSTPESAQ